MLVLLFIIMLTNYSVTLAILKTFGFANLLCKLLHYTKNPGNCNLLQSPGRNIFVPRYHPHSRITRTQGPVTAGTPSCSHRPLPGEQGTHTKAAHSRRPPLSGGGQAPYFPVPHICAVTFYNTKIVEMQGASDYNKENLKGVWRGAVRSGA